MSASKDEREERIEQLVSKTEAHAQMMADRLTELSEQSTRSILRMESSAEQMLSVAAQQQQNFELLLTELRRQSLEINAIWGEARGLQTENRRILAKILNGEQGDSAAEG